MNQLSIFFYSPQLLFQDWTFYKKDLLENSGSIISVVGKNHYGNLNCTPKVRQKKSNFWGV
ncbi:hypothetical protein, partial [Streptococcus sp.]|uniref:hypothetical protein n=1 Tax=Streptococcus sp. TaxID=1306 RepID=UPI0026DC3A92